MSKKKSLILFLIISIATSCSNKPKASQSTDGDAFSNEAPQTQTMSIDNTEEMLSSVRSIYNELIPKYNSNNIDVNNAIHDYCTEEFIELYRKAEKLSAATGQLCIDYDPWIMAQDFGNVSASITSGKILNEQEGSVIVEITNFGNTTTFSLKTKLEHGSWKVDDFLTMHNNNETSIKEELKKFTK